MTENIDANSAAIVRRVLGLLLTPQPPLPTTDSASSGEGETPPPSPSPSQGDHGPRSEAEGGGRGEGEGESDPLQQWEPVIQAVVAACHGNDRAVQQLGPFLDDVAQEGDWRNLVAVLRRIMAGERGVDLIEGLDPVDTVIVRRVLGLLLTPQPPLPTTDSTSSGEGETPLPSPIDSSSVDRRPRHPEQSGAVGAGGEDEGITLEDILNLVIAGAKGDAQAGGQAYQIAQALQHDRNAPPDARALGKGFQNVLEGLRDEDAVQGLPPEAAQIVRAVLEQLE